MGHEDGGNDVCVECPTTKYKDTVGPDTCTVCPTRADNGREQLTAAPGAVDVDDCEIGKNHCNCFIRLIINESN